MLRAEPRGRDPRESLSKHLQPGAAEERATIWEKGPWLRERLERKAEWEREKLGEP